MDSTPQPSSPPLRVPRRIPKACKQCRASKLKCSGKRPCDRCVRRRDNCTFPSSEPHVLVTERYLRQLQGRSSVRRDSPTSQSQPLPGEGHCSQPLGPSDARRPSARQRRFSDASNGTDTGFQAPLPSPPTTTQTGVPGPAHRLSSLLPPLSTPSLPRTSVNSATFDVALAGTQYYEATLGLASQGSLVVPPTSAPNPRQPQQDHSGDLSDSPRGRQNLGPSHATEVPFACSAEPRTSLETPAGSNNLGERSIGAASDRPVPHNPFPHNPLLARNLAFVHDENGTPRFLGPSSTWSFCRHALLLLEAHTPSSDGSTTPLNLDGTAFNMRWTLKGVLEENDLRNLPPADHAMYLFNTVKFHLAELFNLVDEAAFLETFHKFHMDSWGTAQANRLWFIEYLLFLAYGQAFLASGRGNNTLPGSQLAARAFALIPDPAFMFGNPMLAAEVLALVSLYLLSIDMRASAFQYIGQAMRLTYVAGIHRKIPEDVVGSAFATRCNNLWWTVYVLDQELSAGMGAPPSVPEDHASPDLPTARSSSSLAGVLTLRIRLSKLIASMCCTVYGAEEEMGDIFIRNTSAILHQLADVSRELDEITSAFSKTSRSELPRMFTQAALLIHHCIVLATRPLVMWLLTLSIQLGQAESQNLEGPVSTLLHRSAESATTVTTMLRALAEQDMLDAFLPFQLEYVFSSAMLLSIISAILPSYLPDVSWTGSVNIVLVEIIRRQNPVARLRKAELEQLEVLLGPLRKSQQDVTQSSTRVNIAGNGVPEIGRTNNIDPDLMATELTGLPWEVPHIGEDYFLTHSDQMMELADQLESGNFADPFMFDLRYAEN